MAWSIFQDTTRAIASGGVYKFVRFNYNITYFKIKHYNFRFEDMLHQVRNQKLSHYAIATTYSQT